MSAPGPPHPLPVPADQPRVGAGLRGRGDRALRRHGGPDRHAPPSPPDPHAGPADRPVAAGRQARRRHPVLRRPGRRRPAHPCRGAHRGTARGSHRHVVPCRGLRHRGRTHRRCEGPRPRGRRGVRRPGTAGHQRHRCMDRRRPGLRRPRSHQGARLQGRPPRRAPRPHPLRRRIHHPDGVLGAVRHPVDGAAVHPPLDHRHDRHRVGPRQGPPRRQLRRHRLPAGRGQQVAEHPADPRGRRGGLRRAPAVADRRVRSHLQAVPRARGGAGGLRPDHRGGRQVHDLSGHGQGRHRRSGAQHEPTCSGDAHRPAAARRCGRVPGDLEPARTARCRLRPARRPHRAPPAALRLGGPAPAGRDRRPSRAGRPHRRCRRPPDGGGVVRRRVGGGAAPRRRADPTDAHLHRDVGSGPDGRQGRRRCRR